MQCSKKQPPSLEAILDEGMVRGQVKFPGDYVSNWIFDMLLHMAAIFMTLVCVAVVNFFAPEKGSTLSSIGIQAVATLSCIAMWLYVCHERRIVRHVESKIFQYSSRLV